MKSIDFEKPTPPSVYYMKQTISNACGTVAMLHSVANCLDCIDLDEGILKEFLEKTKDATPEEKAKQLEDSSAVCDVHDTIAKQGQTAVRFFLIVFSLTNFEPSGGTKHCYLTITTFLLQAR